MRASEGEFHHRFWVITGFFALAAACFLVDRHVAAGAVATAVHHARGLAGRASADEVRVVFVVAAVVAAAGAALRTWAAAWLRSEVVHDTALHADRVVADGPYRHLRNPLYLGLMLAAIGLATTMSRVGALILVVGVTLFSLRLIGREEAELALGGGESYRRFCAAVPRLLPAITPRLPASGASPRWGQAWLGEAFFWIFPLALTVLAVTLESRAFLAVIGAGMLLRLALAKLWWQRLESRS